MEISMRPGPPPQPTHLKLIRGNPGRRPLNKNEPQPTIAETVPDAPAWLSSFACDEWCERAPELHRLGLLTSLDLSLFAGYCESYSQWRQAQELLAQMAKKDAVTNGLLVRGANGTATPNPLLKVSRLAAQHMLRLASEFGLSPVARSRIAAGVPTGPSKFDGLLG
jgi:P27 family predicted phage terminase small subunit